MRPQAHSLFAGGDAKPAALTQTRPRRIAEISTALIARLREWRRRARSRNELLTLTGNDLRDIGWSRAEAEAEARKAFWEAGI
jgi:uncharacterized protein YjiS (DUF1127 family)